MELSWCIYVCVFWFIFVFEILKVCKYPQISRWLCYNNFIYTALAYTSLYCCQMQFNFMAQRSFVGRSHAFQLAWECSTLCLVYDVQQNMLVLCWLNNVGVSSTYVQQRSQTCFHVFEFDFYFTLFLFGILFKPSASYRFIF